MAGVWRVLERWFAAISSKTIWIITRLCRFVFRNLFRSSSPSDLSAAIDKPSASHRKERTEHFDEITDSSAPVPSNSTAVLRAERKYEIGNRQQPLR